MEEFKTLIETYPWLLPLVIVLSLWDAAWRLVALWHAARSGQLAWFVCLGIISSIGILPIIYLVKFKPENIIQR